VLSAEVVEDCIRFAGCYEETQSSVDKDTSISPNVIASIISSLGFDGNASSSATPYNPYPHAVFEAEAQFYYAGLHSEPTPLYRASEGQRSPPRGLLRPSAV
jgi:hypothetical protein